MVYKTDHEITAEKALYSQSIKIGHQIKVSTGAIVNWYEKKGTLQFQGGEIAKQKLEQDLAKYIEEKSQASFPKTTSNVSPPSSPEIFIVHGHDHVALEQLELALRRLGLEPYILQNTSGNGLTLIEALEREICTPTRSIKFGIVLLTPDDMGYAKSESKTAEKPRARQNVILEMGMLISALSRQNVAILIKQEVEIPSDLKGLRYIPFKNHVRENILELADLLADAGFTLDAKKIAHASR
nr:TIR domain-containing protein [Bartonella washoeensis]